MDALDTYVVYMALKLHFTSKNYDYFRSNGRVKVNPETFYKRNDRWLFTKIGEKHSDEEVVEYFLSNFVNGDSYGGLYISDGATIHTEWKKRMQSITYRFTSEVTDLNNSVNHFDNLFTISDGRDPVILKSFYREDVSVETFVIMNHILGFFSQFSRELVDTYRWPDIEKRCLKYEKFLDIDILKYTTILKNTIIH